VEEAEYGEGPSCYYCAVNIPNEYLSVMPPLLREEEQQLMLSLRQTKKYVYVYECMV